MDMECEGRHHDASARRARRRAGVWTLLSEAEENGQGKGQADAVGATRVSGRWFSRCPIAGQRKPLTLTRDQLGARTVVLCARVRSRHRLVPEYLGDGLSSLI